MGPPRPELIMTWSLDGLQRGTLGEKENTCIEVVDVKSIAKPDSSCLILLSLKH